MSMSSATMLEIAFASSPNVDHVDFETVMLPAHVGAYVGRLLRGVTTVGTAVPRRLSALELYVRVEIVLPAEDTRAILTRKPVHLQTGWHCEIGRA